MTNFYKTLTKNVLDVNHLLNRIKYLEEDPYKDFKERQELENLSFLKDERLDCYGMEIIAGSYFEEYSKNLADDCFLHERGITQFCRDYFDYKSFNEDLKSDYTKFYYNGKHYFISNY